MKSIVPDHWYILDNLKTDGKTHLKFYRDPAINGEQIKGTNCQEVIRALIDRVQFLDNQKRWEGNDEIVSHLRQALMLFEKRALERKVEKGLEIEKLPTGEDGHII